MEQKYHKIRFYFCFGRKFFSDYSRVSNKRTGTFINFWQFFPPVRSYLDQYVYSFWVIHNFVHLWHVLILMKSNISYWFIGHLVEKTFLTFPPVHLFGPVRLLNLTFFPTSTLIWSSTFIWNSRVIKGKNLNT